MIRRLRIRLGLALRRASDWIAPEIKFLDIVSRDLAATPWKLKVGGKEWS